MSIKERLRKANEEFGLVPLYQRFERVIIAILTALIAVIVVAAVWDLTLKILFGFILTGSLDPADYPAFQAVFGMIFTVIIALEFKKSLLVVAERHDSVVQIRSVVVIALLAICRKVIILDLAETDALHILALAAAILALGGVYWPEAERRLSMQRSSKAVVRSGSIEPTYFHPVSHVPIRPNCASYPDLWAWWIERQLCGVRATAPPAIRRISASLSSHRRKLLCVS